MTYTRRLLTKNSNLEVQHRAGRNTHITRNSCTALPIHTLPCLTYKTIQYYDRYNEKEEEMRGPELHTLYPTLHEVKKAMKRLEHGKAPGEVQLIAELLKEGGDALATKIYKLIVCVWQEESKS